jgi:hypothetical protein
MSQHKDPIDEIAAMYGCHDFQQRLDELHQRIMHLIVEDKRTLPQPLQNVFVAIVLGEIAMKEAKVRSMLAPQHADILGKIIARGGEL